MPNIHKIKYWYNHNRIIYNIYGQIYTSKYIKYVILSDNNYMLVAYIIIK